ncbi:MAG: hypothetical protein JSV35_08140 [Candidatus Bathyarchaeota archaeon]|nr:MAG: hypothetical protein JSV35_08140 [Candidatus Bathyarchaeota archaeon]
MKWIEKFAESIERYAGEAVRKDVMEAGGKLRAGSNSAQKALWIRKTMEQLEASTDRETMKKIMIATCPHTYPRRRIQKLKDQYRRLGNLDKLLEVMRNDRSYKGASYYDYPVRKGHSIYMTKVPYSPQAHKKAKTKEAKQLAYCHCPWVKAALTVNEKVPPFFCYCSASWNKQLLEGVLGQQVDAELVQCLLKGDDRCTHAYHLQPDS